MCHPTSREYSTTGISKKTYDPLSLSRSLSIVRLGHHTLSPDKWEQIECHPANLYLFIFRPSYPTPLAAARYSLKNLKKKKKKLEKRKKKKEHKRTELTLLSVSFATWPGYCPGRLFLLLLSFLFLGFFFSLSILMAGQLPTRHLIRATNIYKKTKQVEYSATRVGVVWKNRKRV